MLWGTFVDVVVRRPGAAATCGTVRSPYCNARATINLLAMPVAEQTQAGVEFSPAMRHMRRWVVFLEAPTIACHPCSKYAPHMSTCAKLLSMTTTANVLKVHGRIVHACAINALEVCTASGMSSSSVTRSWFICGASCCNKCVCKR